MQNPAIANQPRATRKSTQIKYTLTFSSLVDGEYSIEHYAPNFRAASEYAFKYAKIIKRKLNDKTFKVVGIE